jgi:plastocyanin
MIKTQNKRYVLSSVLLLKLLICSVFVNAGDLSIQVQDEHGMPLKDAVVYLESNSLKDTNKKLQQDIIQKGKRFNPLVTVIQTGTRINFPNQDKVRHHVYSFSPAKNFELKLYSGVPATPVEFDQAGTVVLGCNIHDRMLAYVYIVDTPLFAKSNQDGLVTLTNVPSGTHIINVWHYALREEGVPDKQQVNLDANKQQLSVTLDINPSLLVMTE